MALLLEAINSKGEVTKFAWPGGYPVFYLMADGETVCPDCIAKNIREVLEAAFVAPDVQWDVVAVDVNWEDSELFCAHCDQRIESAYAD